MESPEVSVFSLYRSGLWRQNTLAWLSPDAVTATDASLKLESAARVRHIKITQYHNNFSRGVQHLLTVKSRISAVWPLYSDTRLPERASHNLSFPSKQHVDTTEEDSSHCSWTMPAWGNKGSVANRRAQTQQAKLLNCSCCAHLVLATVPQDLCREVVYGQSPFKVRHSYERQAGKDKRMCLSVSGVICFLLDEQERNVLII